MAQNVNLNADPHFDPYDYDSDTSDSSAHTIDISSDDSIVDLSDTESDNNEDDNSPDDSEMLPEDVNVPNHGNTNPDRNNRPMFDPTDYELDSLPENPTG